MTDRQPISGVYFLFRKGDLTYVGQSRDCHARIASHRANGREFDLATVMPLEAGQISVVERALIRGFKPLQNKVHIPTPPKAPPPPPKPRFPNALPPELWAPAIASRTPERELQDHEEIGVTTARYVARNHGLPNADVNEAVASGELRVRCTGKFTGAGTSRGEVRLILYRDLKAWCETRKQARLAAIDAGRHPAAASAFPVDRREA